MQSTPRGERGLLPLPPPAQHDEDLRPRRALRPRTRPVALILLAKPLGWHEGCCFLPQCPPRGFPARLLPGFGGWHTCGRLLGAAVPQSRVWWHHRELDLHRGARRGLSLARRRAKLLQGCVEENKEQVPPHQARGHPVESSLLAPCGTDLGLFSPLLQIQALRSWLVLGSRRPRSALRQLLARGASQGGTGLLPAHFARKSSEGHPHLHPREGPGQGEQQLRLCRQPGTSCLVWSPLPRPYSRRRSRGRHQLLRAPPKHRGGWQGGCHLALPPKPCSALGLIPQSSPKRAQHKFHLHTLGEGSFSLRGCSSTEPGRASRPPGPLELPPQLLLRPKTPGRQSWSQEGMSFVPVPVPPGQPWQQLGSQRAAGFLQRAHDPRFPAPNHPAAPLRLQNRLWGHQDACSEQVAPSCCHPQRPGWLRVAK